MSTHRDEKPKRITASDVFARKGKEPIVGLHAVVAAGAFSVVVEGVAEPLAREITRSIAAPTIGIGASAGCDGQILVTDDMLGLFDWTPKFVRRYASLRDEIGRAVGEYAADFRARRFPAEAETYFNKNES